MKNLMKVHLTTSAAKETRREKLIDGRDSKGMKGKSFYRVSRVVAEASGNG